MERLRRAAAPALAVVAAIVGVGSRILDGIDAVQLGLPFWAWEAIGLAAFFAVIFATVHARESEEPRAPRPQLQPIADDGTRAIEFYPDRPSMVKARGGLKQELEGVYVAWAAWYAGTYAAAEEVFESTHKPQKLILLNPDGKYAPIVADLFRRPIEQLRRDIETTRDKALAAGIQTCLFDGPMPLMVIGEPESGNGWVRVELAIPGSAVRPNIVIKQADYPELFQQFVQAYKTMLNHYETVGFAGQ